MSDESLQTLRDWYAANMHTPECELAMKHRHAIPAEVAAAWKDQAPGDTDEERELGFLFALTQIAESLDTVQLLMHNLTLVRGNAIAELEAHVKELEAKNAELTKEVSDLAVPMLVPVSHVDVTPLDHHLDIEDEPVVKHDTIRPPAPPAEEPMAEEPDSEG